MSGRRPRDECVECGRGGAERRKITLPSGYTYEALVHVKCATRRQERLQYHLLPDRHAPDQPISQRPCASCGALFAKKRGPGRWPKHCDACRPAVKTAVPSGG